MNLHDQAHHVGIGKSYMVKIAAPEERIGEILLGIGCDDNHGTVFGFDGLVDLNDIELHLVENIQHVILKIRVGLVDFIDKEDGSLIGRKSLADFTHFDIGLDIAHIPLGIAKAAVIEAGQGVVLVQSLN